MVNGECWSPSPHLLGQEMPSLLCHPSHGLGPRACFAQSLIPADICSKSSALDTEMGAWFGFLVVSEAAGVLPLRKLIHLPITTILIVLKDQLGSQTILASVLFPSH